MLHRFAALLLLFCLHQATFAYYPIIMMHGVNGHATDYTHIRNFTLEAHPGTPVYLLAINQGLDSVFQGLEPQVEKFRSTVEALKREHGIGEHHLMCHSMGGLICRAYVQTQANHTVRNFITLSSPHMGQFGTTKPVKQVLPTFMRNFTRDELFVFFYTGMFQEGISITNFWKDSIHYNDYLKKVGFLPKYNNDANNNPDAPLYKKNMLRVQQWIATGSPGDEIIEPWYSAIFAYYTCPSKGNPTLITNMKDQQVYLQDTFGLKTLDEEARLKIHVAPNAKHMDWLSNIQLFRDYIEPYLD